MTPQRDRFPISSWLLPPSSPVRIPASQTRAVPSLPLREMLLPTCNCLAQLQSRRALPDKCASGCPGNFHFCFGSYTAGVRGILTPTSTRTPVAHVPNTSASGSSAASRSHRNMLIFLLTLAVDATPFTELMQPPSCLVQNLCNKWRARCMTTEQNCERTSVMTFIQRCVKDLTNIHERCAVRQSTLAGLPTARRAQSSTIGQTSLAPSGSQLCRRAQPDPA